MSEMKFVLDLNSARAQKARLRQTLSDKRVEWILGVTIVIFDLAGTYLLATDSPLGWLAFVPVAAGLVIWFWRKGDLERLAIGKFSSGQKVLLHEALDPGMLAALQKPQDISAYDLWKALSRAPERYFLENRYLIDNSFFESNLARAPGSAEQVWRKAAELQQKYAVAGYGNMLILAALVLQVPEIDRILHAVQLEPADIEASVPWMRDLDAKAEEARKKKGFGGIGRDWAYGYTPILGQVGHNMTHSIEAHGFFLDTSMHERVITQTAQILGNRGTPALIGEVGVGKTTSVYALAERLMTDSTQPARIRYNQIVELDASALIANAPQPGQLEDLMIRILNEAHRAKNIILFFDEAHVFFGSGTGAVDLSNVLMPAIESGSIRLIFAMSPQHWQRLAHGGIAGKLQPVNVAPADRDATLAVLRDKIAFIEYDHKKVFTYQALQEAYKLAGRYVNTQAMPGAALNVVQQTAAGTRVQLITREVVQQAVEQAYGVKLQTAQSAQADESGNLLKLEENLRKYVISQDRAITVVSDALRRSRSGVGNPERPIGTFLFLGPTGVGKTELSKALARVYFGSEKAIIRVDMNQYVGADDVNRLISPSHGDQLGFLGEVRRQPFSVILLDEIEKAHSAVVNALLQMLDEGVMRDSDNKAVSFKDAIIIATSNAGADEIRHMIEDGKDLAQMETTFADLLISRGAFAPEFINRFDEVVLFKPLSQDDLVKVIDLILADINKTLDPQKVRVELTDDAKRWLVSKGYDSRLGARPMRRMAQRYVENIVAKRLLDRSLQPGGVLRLDTGDFEQTG